MKNTKPTTAKSLPAKVKKVKSKPSPAKASPKTAEQIAEISRASNNFEGVRKIDHLPFKDQMEQIFNPLHTITKTTVGDTITSSTYTVNPKK